MDLVKATRTSQPRLSQQLALMRRIGVVVTRRAGATIYYRLAGDRIRKTCRILHELLDRPGACCCHETAAPLVKAVKPRKGTARRSTVARVPREHPDVAPHEDRAGGSRS